jgi:formylglycine-generating enzyme required for sulfatase activity
MRDNKSGTNSPKTLDSHPIKVLRDLPIYREWLIGETDHIDIRGIGERKIEDPVVFPILQLYTQLYVQSGSANFDLDQGNIREEQRTPLTKMIEATRCVAIIGEPGCGKTTFLRYTTRSFAMDTAKPLPIFLALTDVYEFAISQNLNFDAKLFIDFCADLNARENLDLTKEFLENRIESGDCLWLLDSLDELPSDNARINMVEALEKASRRWNKSRFVVTSRPAPMIGKSIPIGFEVVTVDNWRNQEIKSFLEAFTSLLYPKIQSEERLRRHWGGLYATIRDSLELRTLAKNPVMLTAMAVVHFNEIHLPEGRADLLESLISWLLHSRRRSVDSARPSYQFCEKRYQELALAMFESENQNRSSVGQLWAAQALAEAFNHDPNAALEFLQREAVEVGVLVRRRGDLAFWHQSFQEYLAAKEIAGKTDNIENGWWPKIKNNLDKSQWRDIIVLVPSCLSRLGSDRVDLFFEYLAQSCINATLTTKAKRLALMGIILRDLRLSSYKLKPASSWTNILKQIAPSLFGLEGVEVPIQTRYEAVVAYGLLGDPRLRNFEETWIPLPGGTFLFGAQDQNPGKPNYDPDAKSWEGPVIEKILTPFEIRKYPITIGEFDLFVLAGGYQDKTNWIEDEFEWRIRNKVHTPLDWDEQKLTPNCPVTGISWYEANAYCRWLTREKAENMLYRLPEEVEWEYAARHGIVANQRFPWGNNTSIGDKAEANVANCGLRKKTPVGIFPKATTQDGITDMIGNVEEWCDDHWNPEHSSNTDNKLVKDDVSLRAYVVKGGSAIRFSRLCRVTYRSKIYAEKRHLTVGFRPVRTKKFV